MLVEQWLHDFLVKISAVPSKQKRVYALSKICRHTEVASGYAFASCAPSPASALVFPPRLTEHAPICGSISHKAGRQEEDDVVAEEQVRDNPVLARVAAGVVVLLDDPIVS